MKRITVRALLSWFISVALSSAAVVNAVAEEADKQDKKQSSQQQADKEQPAIKLESVFVGDKEQPAISYFIPWQGIGAPDKLYWNVEEKHDNALDLVDRDILLRSINIYEEMQLEAGDK